jgi:hypothetical protein
MYQCRRVLSLLEGVWCSGWTVFFQVGKWAAVPSLADCDAGIAWGSFVVVCWGDLLADRRLVCVFVHWHATGCARVFICLGGSFGE